MDKEIYGGLSLLQDYCSSSDNSEEEFITSKPEVSKQSKSTNKLPLPDDLLNLYPKKLEVIDDPNSHGGRIRSFPHERGNWSTLIYITLQYNFKQLQVILENELKCCCGDINWIEEPHVSLSKTLVLQRHWIVPLVESLRNHLKLESRFIISIRGFDFFCNEENSRTFLALKVEKSQKKLKNLVSKVDKCVEEFRLPVYYKEPKFHASIAWFLNDQISSLKPILNKLNTLLENHFKIQQCDTTFDVSDIVMKTGNKLYNFPLR